MKKLLAGLMAGIMALGLSVSAFASKNEPDLSVKQNYYAEYVRIAEETAQETGLDISVLPMKKLTKEDWRTPEEFRTMIREIANWSIDCTELSRMANTPSSAAEKTAAITIDGCTYRVSVAADFQTRYHSTTHRKHFAGINSVTSGCSENTGTWKQLGCEYNIMDAARTYGVTVGGELTIAGVKFGNKLAYAEFYCGADGQVR